MKPTALWMRQTALIHGRGITRRGPALLLEKHTTVHYPMGSCPLARKRYGILPDETLSRAKTPTTHYPTGPVLLLEKNTAVHYPTGSCPLARKHSGTLPDGSLTNNYGTLPGGACSLARKKHYGTLPDGVCSRNTKGTKRSTAIRTDSHNRCALKCTNQNNTLAPKTPERRRV